MPFTVLTHYSPPPLIIDQQKELTASFKCIFLNPYGALNAPIKTIAFLDRLNSEKAPLRIRSNKAQPTIHPTLNSLKHQEKMCYPYEFTSDQEIPSGMYQIRHTTYTKNLEPSILDMGPVYIGNDIQKLTQEFFPAVELEILNRGSDFKVCKFQPFVFRADQKMFIASEVVWRAPSNINSTDLLLYAFLEGFEKEHHELTLRSDIPPKYWGANGLYRTTLLQEISEESLRGETFTFGIKSKNSLATPYAEFQIPLKSPNQHTFTFNQKLFNETDTLMMKQVDILRISREEIRIKATVSVQEKLSRNYHFWLHAHPIEGSIKERYLDGKDFLPTGSFFTPPLDQSTHSSEINTNLTLKLPPGKYHFKFGFWNRDTGTPIRLRTEDNKEFLRISETDI